MPTSVPAERELAAATPMRREATTPVVSARILAWLTEHPGALAVVESVWGTLAELEATGQHPRLLAAVRFALIHHEPTRAGRCRACRRESWRRFPCVVWRQIRGELLGHLNIGDVHRVRAGSGRSLS